MLEDSTVTVKEHDRQSADNFVYCEFPDQRRLDDLLRLQREERNYLEFIERNGATGRVVEFLRSMVEARELEIKALRTNGQFPSSQG
jgi:hypothetical protein